MPVQSRYSVDNIEGFPLPGHKKIEEISESEGRRLFDHFLRERKMLDKLTLKRRNEILYRLSTFLRTLRIARSTI